MGDESDIKSLDFWSRVDMAFPSHDSPSRGTCVSIVVRQRLEMIEAFRRIQRFWLVGYWASKGQICRQAIFVLPERSLSRMNGKRLRWTRALREPWDVELAMEGGRDDGGLWLSVASRDGASSLISGID